MTKSCTHASHPKVVSRLKRAEGHLRSVITIIEDGRSCLEADEAHDRAELKAISRYL